TGSNRAASSGQNNAAQTSPSQSVPDNASGSAKSLPKPTLSFSDTGFSLSDGLTKDGRWTVSGLNGLGWEYSLDMGQSWIPGSGNFFVVQGDGPKMIWVRTRDDQGNTSEIVKVTCTLDTTAPAALQTVSASQAGLRKVSFIGLEPQARWEYRLDPKGSWLAGSGAHLWLAGNGLSRLETRQIDAAGNISAPTSLDLAQAGGDDRIEFSNNPLAPSKLSAAPPAGEALLLHGSVRDPDKDYILITIPASQALRSLKLVHYASDDKIAFFAIQRAAVFDAGIDTSRMIAFGHFGPEKLGDNLLASLSLAQRASGPMVLWVQQTGSLSTDYVFELMLETNP
ncbi:MAG: hypothetical protein EBX64_08685, partial [Betaproteobacteria bacterium]|nr:hypothetical protein [Betaproteobacteria bacterium]